MKSITSLPKFIYIKISQSSVLLPVIAGLLQYKKLPAAFRVLLYFFMVAILFEIQASIFKRVYHNNMPGQHLYTVIEFLSYSVVFYLNFRKNSMMRRLIAVNAVVFAGVAVADAFYINGIWAPNAVSLSYSSVSIIVYSLACFYVLFQQDTLQYSWVYPMFWVSTGTLIYFASNMLYFMLKRYLLIKAANIETFSLIFHDALNIIANCLFAQSFRCFGKRKTLL